MTKGHLTSKGIFVPRKRLRESLRRVKAEGRNERQLSTISRRRYFSPCPNYVWHMDSTHKLVKWRFVVHACIDGYSRFITFCKCATNNKSNTVLQLFLKAEENFGLPLRVRTDYGVENISVWEYMLSKRNNSNAIIVGSSVHNQRVERLHRDINTQVLNNFYNGFVHLEKNNRLDPLSESDLFCLHLIYLPAINQRILEFTQAHNNHPISTERNYTPLQLFYLNRRLLHLQSLDPSGSLDVNGILRHSTNDIRIPPVHGLPSNYLRSLLKVLNQNAHRNALSLYCMCRQRLLQCLNQL